jgi:hypothetical protein
MLPYQSVTIDTTEISDWSSFHDVFARELGFPDFYGRNMNAWIDCMTSLDSPDDGLTKVHAPESGVLVLNLEGMREFSKRCPELSCAIEECSAFVNWRRIEVGEPPVLVLSYS